MKATKTISIFVKFICSITLFSVILNCKVSAETYYSTDVKKGTSSYNTQTSGYGGWNWGEPINSYLYENNGYLYRLENIGDKIILEKYNSNFRYMGKGEIKKELPVFGGFFSGKDYNFIIFGQNNPNDSREKEVMRVVKYTKGMKKVAAKSYYGCNTYKPFCAGTPRMDEYNGVLYIHANHEMFMTRDDGLHHQSNMDFYIKISDMSTIYSRYDISNPVTGYVSHSMNQFIKVNENGIYTVDHGDGYNRSIMAFRRNRNTDTYAGYEDVFKIKGKIGDNYTGVCVGGMELGERNMLIAGTSVPQDSTWGNNKQQNLFIIKLPLYGDYGEKTKVTYLTKYKSSDNVRFSEPKLVKTGDNSFMLLWSETKNSTTKLYVTALDGNGEKVGKTYAYNANVSDCQPTVYNGKVTYYVTKGGAPTFYYFNADGSMDKQKAAFEKKK